MQIIIKKTPGLLCLFVGLHNLAFVFYCIPIGLYNSKNNILIIITTK